MVQIFWPPYSPLLPSFSGWVWHIGFGLGTSQPNQYHWVLHYYVPQVSGSAAASVFSRSPSLSLCPMSRDSKDWDSRKIVNIRTLGITTIICGRDKVTRTQKLNDSEPQCLDLQFSTCSTGLGFLHFTSPRQQCLILKAAVTYYKMQRLYVCGFIYLFSNNYCITQLILMSN